MMPTLEAVLAFAHMPRNGYVHFSVRRTGVTTKPFYQKALMCRWHFICWMLFQTPQFLVTDPAFEGASRLLDLHCRGELDEPRLLAAVAANLEAGRIRVRKVTGYDSKYRQGCYYCGGKDNGRMRGKEMTRGVRYVNGPGATDGP